MTLRDLTDEEIEVLQRHCNTEYITHMKQRSLRSRGSEDHFRAGYNACLRARLALEPKRPSQEPMIE